MGGEARRHDFAEQLKLKRMDLGLKGVSRSYVRQVKGLVRPARLRLPAKAWISLPLCAARTYPLFAPAVSDLVAAGALLGRPSLQRYWRDIRVLQG